MITQSNAGIPESQLTVFRATYVSHNKPRMTEKIKAVDKAAAKTLAYAETHRPNSGVQDYTVLKVDEI